MRPQGEWEVGLAAIEKGCLKVGPEIILQQGNNCCVNFDDVTVIIGVDI